MENLILQANHLSSDGSKLLKGNGRLGMLFNVFLERPSSSYEAEESVRYRTSLNDLQYTKKMEHVSTLDYSKVPQQTFSPMDKSYHSQTYRGGFSPTKYENLI